MTDAVFMIGMWSAVMFMFGFSLGRASKPADQPRVGTVTRLSIQPQFSEGKVRSQVKARRNSPVPPPPPAPRKQAR